MLQPCVLVCERLSQRPSASCARLSVPGGTLDGEAGMDVLILLEFVDRRLSEGDKFAHIAASLGMGRNILTRKLAEEGWGGVYLKVPMDELKAIILNKILLSRVGSNWGIWSVQAALKLQKLRVPRSSVRDALKELQPKHMERR